MSNQLLDSMLDQAIKNLDGVAPLINNLKAERDRLAAENKRLREVVEKFDALIQYQYSGSREAMSALQNVADLARAALKEKP